MAKSLTLLLVGLGLLGGAAVLREQSPGPQDITPVDRQLVARLQKAAATPEPTPALTPTPAETALMLGRPSPLPGGEASPSSRPSPSAPADASPSPSPSDSPGGSPSPGPSPSPSPSGSPGSVAELHQRAIVVDTHVDTPYWISETHIKLKSNKRQVDLARLKAGGVDVVFFSILVNPARYGKIAKNQADYIIQTLKRELTANADSIELATSYNDIQRILAKGKIAGLMGMEGGEPIENSVDNVNHFYQLGVRYLSPTWSLNNQLGDSSGPARPRWKGLSPLGKDVVKRMNQLGMLIDVSHLSDATYNDVLKLSTQPVIASHSGVDGIRVSPRNLSDNMLKLLSLNGGVVGIMFYPPILSATGKANVASVVNHIEYAVKVAGIDHVGLGSDFDGLDTPPPKGLEDAGHFPAITAELRKRGYKDEDILKILGGNFMTVFAQVLK